MSEATKTPITCYAIVAEGEGAGIRLINSAEPQDAMHEFMCVCGAKSWLLCETDDVREQINMISSDDNWIFDEGRRRFSIDWKHECDKVTLFALPYEGVSADMVAVNQHDALLAEVERLKAIPKADEVLACRCMMHRAVPPFPTYTSAPEECTACVLNHRDFEWVGVCASVDTSVAFGGDPKRYMEAILAPLLERASREAQLAVSLREHNAALRGACEEVESSAISVEFSQNYEITTRAYRMVCDALAGEAGEKGTV